jgi:hypothetical protein
LLRILKAAACVALFAIACGPASAQEKSAVKPGFTLPTGGNVRILLFRPWIKVGAQSTGGLYEPNADWTDQAKQNINLALTAAQGHLGNKVVVADEPVGPAAEQLAEYRALFSTVARAVITYQFFPGNRLPTKKRKGQFDYTLGPGVKDIPGAADADYILFLNTEDQYGSTGRKALQLFSAMVGVGVTSGVHSGFAGLVEVKTGDLVWLNADLQMGGDVRSAEGADKRVAQLLEDFPGSAPPVLAAR